MVYVAAREAGPAVASPNRPVRVVEHWNWAGDARKAIPVEVYTNCAAAELFLNGRSLGEKPVADRLNPVLHWDVPNEPGVLRAVGKRDAKEAARFELVTAGAPHHIVLTPDRATLAADGHDLSSVAIQVVDAQGRRVYGAGADVEVHVSGPGELAALDSGDLRDISPVAANHRKVYEGRALAMVRAGVEMGTVTVRASAPGLVVGEVVLTVK
jgi:beta-galactosidase